MAGGAVAAIQLLISSTGEATWGSTAGVASRKFHGASEDSSLTIVEAVEAVPTMGWYGPGPIAEQVSQSGEGELKGTAVYEDIVWLLGGLFTYSSQSTGGSTDSSGGTTGPWVYMYDAPVTSTQVVATYVIEYGTTNQAYKAIGAIINGLTITGEAGGLWEFSAPLLAKHVIPTSGGLTTAATVDSRTVNPIRMADTQIYMDAHATGVPGTTLINANLISFELGIDAKRHMKTFAGSEFPGGWGDGRMEGTLKTVLEFGSTSKTLLDEMLTSTGVALERNIRIKATQGSSVSRKGFYIDFSGMQSEPVKLWDDRDGNMTVALSWTGKHSTANVSTGVAVSGDWLRLMCENGSSSTT